MSEEILKALMQLFAIVAKQDDGASENIEKFVEDFLYTQLNEELVIEYKKLYEEFLGPADVEGAEPKKKLTSVKDSVRTLGICKKINKTLTQKQKVVVLVRLLELLKADNSFTEQRMALVDTIGEAFNFDKEEFKAIQHFVIQPEEELESINEILLINDKHFEADHPHACKHVHSGLQGSIIILKVLSEDLYFLRYTGGSDIYLNGLPVNYKRIYLFASGSTVKVPTGKPVYYSDVVSHFLADSDVPKISFEANQLEFKFPNGKIGLRDINISEPGGKLIGIMGASGAGKTTLLNVLSGIEFPSGGEVLINGINIHTRKEDVKGIIGYIPQDDLLIEELTVYENLFYNAKLCFKDKTDQELDVMVLHTLQNLGLIETKDLKVGNPLQKTISGGQRKRLNIGLELIREPSLLFVDEPTSGLSSRDSENVIDLLRELTLKGKLIYVVIHQPSSDIYKMFDKMVFLDVGGYLIYYGNPVEAIVYFKKADLQANADQGECPVCGNVNPEIIFNIIESKIVDEYGRTTDKRKILPTQWRALYDKNVVPDKTEPIKESPPKALNIPTWFNQFKIFITRDLLSKISNKQYLIINLVEAPLLALILAFIIRYTAKADKGYVFRENDNIPAFIFMSIIVLLFIGLTVSAEEIFKDKRILKRESFLNLSRSSYLFSKIGILFTLSAIQALLFVLVGNSIVGIKGMYFEYWLVLFSVSCFANILGLNISNTFNSAVTIYILIPLLVIPQMILGGAMFNFLKLNTAVGGGPKVPVIAEVMVSRWAYEALAVNQFKNNNYEKVFYKLDKQESEANYKLSHWVPEVRVLVDNATAAVNEKGDSAQTVYQKNVAVLVHELAKEGSEGSKYVFPELATLSKSKITDSIAIHIGAYLDSLENFYKDKMNVATKTKDEKIAKLQTDPKKTALFYKVYDDCYNEYLSDVVKQSLESKKVVLGDDKLIQVSDPIFLNPAGKTTIRSHFYSPEKYFAGITIPTLYFNMIVVWLFSILLYISLYYSGLTRLGLWIDQLLEKVSEFKNKLSAKIAAQRAAQLAQKVAKAEAIKLADEAKKAAEAAAIEAKKAAEQAALQLKKKAEEEAAAALPSTEEGVPPEAPINP